MNKDEALERKAENARELGLDYEPVAYVETKEVHGQMCSFIYRADSTKLLPNGTKLYATPPQRTWIGLNEDELYEASWQENRSFLDGAKWAEAKLKERN
jgi:hypothetical protein